MYLNKAIIYGNLTRDPELKSLPSGSAVVSFGVATNRTWKDKDGSKKEQTEFHNIVAFGRTAEVIAQYMKKGKPIYVEGRVQTRSWEGKEDGKKQYRTEIVCETFQFGPSAPGERTEAQDRPSPSTAEEQVDAEINAEDIPF
jgi:single-strand DNA-binding protein